MKKRIIGLFGAAVNNPNLGCVALTFSLIKTLESISQLRNEEFIYFVFEGKTSEAKRMNLCNRLDINPCRVQCFSVYFQFSYRSGFLHLQKSVSAYKAMKKCDLFIDLTNGDSFTDIYGQGRFDGLTRIKEIIEKNEWPLILGPQTYGPFHEEKNQNRAKRVIEAATCVIARDQASANYVQSISNKKVYVTTDLAFGLPYETKRITTNKICVGLNISSLLLSRKTESTQRNFKIKTDYDAFTKSILTYLSDNSDVYKTYIIPHVGEDGGKQFLNEFPNMVFVDPFYDPISAKSFISSMDVFIGARMHATIGAFSSGVATIPVAYSRKFKGLYESLSHPYLVDLQTLSTEAAINLAIQYIKEWKEIKESEVIGREIFLNNNQKNIEILNAAIDLAEKQFIK